MRRSLGLVVLSSDHISMYIYLFNIGDSSGPNARGWIGFPIRVRVRVRMERSIGLVSDPVYICMYVSKGYTTPQYTDSGEHSYIFWHWIWDRSCEVIV